MESSRKSSGRTRLSVSQIARFPRITTNLVIYVAKEFAGTLGTYGYTTLFGADAASTASTDFVRSLALG